MWALLKRRINSRRPRPNPTTAEAIKQAVIEEWDALTVDDYEQMILSMPERIRKGLANEGGAYLVVDGVKISTVYLEPTPIRSFIALR